MRYGNRRFRTAVRKPAKPYVPPTPEQVEARRKAVEAYNASLPKPKPFLTPEDPDAFLDMEKNELPGTKYADMKDYTVECPKCKGHGYWNLAINQYQNENPAKRHFRAMCNQCNSWGYVKPGLDTACIHEFHEVSAARASELGVSHYGNCYHVYECAKGCGRTMAHDSSDSFIVLSYALKAIINQLTGIAYSDLSTAEQNILRIAVRGLGMTLYVNDDVITVK